MKYLIVSVVVNLLYILCLPLHGQKLSPQAQAAIDRLSPAQRAKALKEAGLVSSQPKGSESSLTALPFSRNRENGTNEKANPDISKQDPVLILSELESSLRLALEQEKQNLSDAEKGLSSSAFFQVGKGYNDRIYDMEKLLAEIKSAKINLLRDKVLQVQVTPEKKIFPFGYDFFNESIQRLNQASITSIPSNYNVGPGDYLGIELFGQENAGYSVMIGQNGMIQFPGIGPLNAFEKGGSFQNLKNLIKEKVRVHLGEGVQVSVSMEQVRQIKVFLAGEFKQPGVRLLSATSTIIEALLQSGGLNEYGSLRKVTLKRKGRPDTIYDFYSLLINGDNPAIDSLLEGDVVFLPRVDSRVTLKGEIARPAIYELGNSNSLKDVIRLAGGFGSRAYPSEIRLFRMDEYGHKSLKSLSIPSDEGFKIQNGDIIQVGSSTDFAKTAIKLTGEVDHLGEYEWNKNTTLSDVISNKFIFKENADLNYALIRRLDDNGNVKILSFSPNDLFAVSQGSQNFPLHQKDKIIILSKFNSATRERVIRPLLRELSFAAEPAVGSNVVSINGEVHFPGDYPKTLGMKATDLIIAAGGMKESAYSLVAEISRVKVDLNNSQAEAYIEHILLDALQTKDSLKVLLEPGDVLSVRKIPAWQEDRVVVLSGEIKFPGKYTISKNEKLGEVFRRAGGLTNEAFPHGAVFTREVLISREEEQKQKLVQQLESDIASLSLSPTAEESSRKANSVAQSLLNRLKTSKSAGRLVIDLNLQLQKPEESQITLRNGDKIHVPIFPSEVSVLGEVQFPTSHLHDPKLSTDNYINLSGGFSQNADEKRIFVVKANGAVLTNKGNGWFDNQQSDKIIQLGDVIVVPLNLQKGKWLETLTSSTQIIYQLAVAAAAVNSF